MIRALILVSLLIFTLLSPAYSASPYDATLVKGETARIQNHLRHVETTLRSRQTSHLSPAQRTARKQNLDTLRRYWQRGVFPRNEHFPGRRVPYFRDAHGTLCAMAYLIAESGNRSFVEQVARTNNNAFVRELASSPVLRRWLRENGLTVAEAAWIQPTYGQPGPPDYVQNRFDNTTLIGLTAISAMLCSTAIATNVVRPPSVTDAKIRGAYGIAAGWFSMAVGASDLGDGNNQTLKSANTAMGVASIGYGLYSLVTSERRGRSRKPPTMTALPAREFASFVSPTGGSVRATWRF